MLIIKWTSKGGIHIGSIAGMDHSVEMHCSMLRSLMKCGCDVEELTRVKGMNKTAAKMFSGFSG
ncbi:MAG: hypothetical protein ACLUIQ_01530 [Dialister invisus]